MIPVEPEKGVPLPFDLADEAPKTHKDAVAVAANTAELIEQLGGSIDYSNEDLHKAAALVTGAGKGATPQHVSTSAEAAAVAAIMRRWDFTAFGDPSQARNFITNKLVQIADCGDPKLELKALELLGKHSDIGLFTERSEITVHHTSAKSLEDSIKERIKRLLGTNQPDTAQPSPLDDLDAYLGPKVIIPRGTTSGSSTTGSGQEVAPPLDTAPLDVEARIIGGNGNPLAADGPDELSGEEGADGDIDGESRS